MIKESNLMFHERIFFKKLQNYESQLISRARIYTKIPDSTKFYVKNE